MDLDQNTNDCFSETFTKSEITKSSPFSIWSEENDFDLLNQVLNNYDGRINWKKINVDDRSATACEKRYYKITGRSSFARESPWSTDDENELKRQAELFNHEWDKIEIPGRVYVEIFVKYTDIYGKLSGSSRISSPGVASEKNHIIIPPDNLYDRKCKISANGGNITTATPCDNLCDKVKRRRKTVRENDDDDDDGGGGGDVENQSIISNTKSSSSRIAAPPRKKRKFSTSSSTTDNNNNFNNNNKKQNSKKEGSKSLNDFDFDDSHSIIAVKKIDVTEASIQGNFMGSNQWLDCNIISVKKKNEMLVKYYDGEEGVLSMENIKVNGEILTEEILKSLNISFVKKANAAPMSKSTPTQPSVQNINSRNKSYNLSSSKLYGSGNNKKSSKQFNEGDKVFSDFKENQYLYPAHVIKVNSKDETVNLEFYDEDTEKNVSFSRLHEWIHLRVNDKVEFLKNGDKNWYTGYINKVNKKDEEESLFTVKDEVNNTFSSDISLKDCIRLRKDDIKKKKVVPRVNKSDKSPVVKDVIKKQLNPNSPIREGDMDVERRRVLCKWEGAKYLAVITKVHGNETFDVQFDDSTRQFKVPLSDLQPSEAPGIYNM